MIRTHVLCVWALPWQIVPPKPTTLMFCRALLCAIIARQSLIRCALGGGCALIASPLPECLVRWVLQPTALNIWVRPTVVIQAEADIEVACRVVLVLFKPE